MIKPNLDCKHPTMKWWTTNAPVDISSRFITGTLDLTKTLTNLIAMFADRTTFICMSYFITVSRTDASMIFADFALCKLAHHLCSRNWFKQQFTSILWNKWMRNWFKQQIFADGTVTYLKKREELASNVSLQFLGLTGPQIFKDSKVLEITRTTISA